MFLISLPDTIYGTKKFNGGKPCFDSMFHLEGNMVFLQKISRTWDRKIPPET